MKNIVASIFLLLLCTPSCTKKVKINKSEIIKMNSFSKGFSNNRFYFIKSSIKIHENEKLFYYIFNGVEGYTNMLIIDSLDNVYFNYKKLDFVDRKMIKLKDTIINVEKYENYNTYNLFDLRYFYLNKDSGLILEEFLDKENITVYDIKRFNKIHNIILRDSLLFKESDSILKMKKWLKKVNSTRKYTHQTPSR